MKLAHQIALAVALLLSFVCMGLTISGIWLHAAPAPLAKPANKIKPGRLEGWYEVMWGSQKCYIFLSGGGDYRCKWFYLNYVGSWSIDGKTFTIVESANPDNPNSWMSYRFELDAEMRTGHIDGDTSRFRIQLTPCKESEVP